MNSTSMLQDSFKNDDEVFLGRLSRYVILDIGTIEDIDVNGRARVVSSTFMNNKPIVYEDAEVIFPGNANGCYAAEGRNMACLIFIPRSCMPEVSDLVLEIGKPSYDKDGVKAMPIGDGVANKIKMHYSDGGDLSLLGQTYDVDYTENTVTLSTKDGTTSLSMDAQGQLYLTYRTDNGTRRISVEDGVITKEWWSKDKDVLWTDTLNQDGSRSFVQTDPNDEQADPLFSISIAADGTATIGMKKALTLETRDALTLKGKTVAIESTDGVTTMTSSDDINVTSGNNKKFTVNGTNLEVEK